MHVDSPKIDSLRIDTAYIHMFGLVVCCYRCMLEINLSFSNITYTCDREYLTISVVDVIMVLVPNPTYAIALTRILRMNFKILSMAKFDVYVGFKII